MTEKVLETKELWAGYYGVAAVRNLTIDIEPGEIFALLGPNGSGKSTTLLTLAGVLKPIKGDVKFVGHSISAMPSHSIAQLGILLVPETRGIFSTLTVKENLALVRAKASERTIDAALDLFPQLKARINNKGNELSGGEQQMLALARAIAMEPKLLMVDEMSLGLAPNIVVDLLDKLTDLSKKLKMAILLVEQHISMALKYANKFAVLRHGECVLKGDAIQMSYDPQLLYKAYFGIK